MRKFQNMKRLQKSTEIIALFLFLYCFFLWFLKLICPKLFPKLCFRPEIFEKLNFRARIFNKNDADDIVAKTRFLQAENFAINPRRSGNLSLLSQINRRNRRSKIVRRARFYFDETQDVSVQSNQINLARNRRAKPISANRNFKVCQNKTVIVFYQKPRGKLFAELPDLTCIRRR